MMVYPNSSSRNGRPISSSKCATPHILYTEGMELENKQLMNQTTILLTESTAPWIFRFLLKILIVKA